MRRIIHWLLGPYEETRPSTSTEHFGGTSVDVSWGAELLKSSPQREAYLTAIRDLLRGIPGEAWNHLVERVLLRFALYVFDLPGSQADHHARPFGLFDHSIEVAHGNLEALSARKLHFSHDPVADEQERPPWTYAAFLSGLLHDVGKLHDLEVRTEDGKHAWNPQLEPLATWLARHGLERSTPQLLTFRTGRGLNDHVWRSSIFSPLILPPEAVAYLGERLLFVTEASLEGTFGKLPPHIPRGARKLAALLKKSDERSVAGDQGTRVSDSPSPPESGSETVNPPAQNSSAPSPPEVPPPNPPGDEPARDPSPTEDEPAQVSDDAPMGGDPEKDKGSVRQDPSESGEESIGRSPQPTRPDPQLVPGPSRSREEIRRIARELRPEKLVTTLWTLLRGARLQRNRDDGQVFIRRDFTWFLYPSTFEKLLASKNLPRDGSLHKPMLQALTRVEGGLVLFGPNDLLARISTGGDINPITGSAFRLKTDGFLTPEDLESLGVWDHEIEVAGASGSGSPRTPSEVAA